MAYQQYMQQERHRPPTKGFQCREDIEKDDYNVTSVIFKSNLPSHQVVEFNCRYPSCGALEGEEERAVLDDDDYVVDPNLFDEGYSLAASTGFKVWTGSRLLIEALTWPQDTDCDRLKEIQECINNHGGTRIIELGAGVGVVGTYLSAVGSHVLLTDLSTLVENAIHVNLERNESILASFQIDGNDCVPCPSWLATGRRMGKGWADAASLDWTKHISEQITYEQSSSIDMIIASDVVFLRTMMKSLFDTVEALFQASKDNKPSLILSFQKRDAKDGKESEAFTTVDGVLAAVEERGWKVECLAWRTVAVRVEDATGLVQDDTSEVFVFEIKDASSSP
jgi:hypothetical protein